MDINNMNETQVKQELKKLIRSSYRKMETLRKRGYEDYQWNKDYRGFMQEKFGVKTGKAMLKRVDDLSFNQARGLLAYNERHLRGYESSITGVRKMEKESLELIGKLSGSEDDWNIQRKRSGDYEVTHDGTTEKITPQELSDFWKMVRKVDEDHSLQTLKGGSGEGVPLVYEYYFQQKDKSITSIMAKVNKVYTDEQLEAARKAEEREAELERIRGKKKFTNR